MLSSKLLSSLPNLQHSFLLPGESSLDTYSAHQVHKANWVWIPNQAATPQVRWQADALGSAKIGQSIGVYSADCVPILATAVTQDQRAISVLAIHAGWRGTAQRIADRVVQAWLQILAQDQKTPLKVFAAIGPCIHQESFEVGPEIPGAFSESEAQRFSRYLREEEGRKKYLFDLVAANQEQLKIACQKKGVALEIDLLDQCTFQNKSLPSFRRDGKNAGRIFSTIALRS